MSTPGQVLDALPAPLITISVHGHITAANAAAENYFKSSAAGLKRLDLDAIIPSTSPLGDLITAVRTGHARINEYGVRIGTPRTGGERLVDVQLAPVGDGSGDVLVMVLARSMAAKIDRQLTHRGAARAVTGMATMLAHEIKNPLSGIMGAAQLLEPGLDEGGRELTRMICAETSRIVRLVDQMEVFSDERPIAREPVNIHVVLNQVKQLAMAGFASNIAIRETYDPSLPPVPGQFDQLTQVFVNLVKNAAEAIAMRPNGEIALTSAYRPGVRLKAPGTGEPVSLPLEVCVHDNGPGIPDDMRAHLFDPFVTSRDSGKGLGLALVAKIIHDHGGVVEYESTGRKTTFRVLLPVFRQEPANGAMAPGDKKQRAPAQREAAR